MLTHFMVMSAAYSASNVNPSIRMQLWPRIGISAQICTVAATALCSPLTAGGSRRIMREEFGTGRFKAGQGRRGGGNTCACPVPRFIMCRRCLCPLNGDSVQQRCRAGWWSCAQLCICIAVESACRKFEIVGPANYA